MIEFLDNLLQLLVTLICWCISGVFYYHSRKQAYFLLTSFFGCFTFAGLYWTLYFLLFYETPQVFYVSEIGWISGCIFLYLLQYTISDEKERDFKSHAVWISVIIGIPLYVFYSYDGDILFNAITNFMMILISWWSIRGLLYMRYQEKRNQNCYYFHILTLCFVFLEYCLWIASVFWIGDTLSNPYFMIDFLLTIWRIFLLIVVRKVVEQ